MRAGENRSDVESELESEDTTEVGDDMIFFKEDESREVIATSVEHRDPVAVFAGGEQEAERHDNVPVPRKRAASADAVGEREAKRTRSPRPLAQGTPTGAVGGASSCCESCTGASPSDAWVQARSPGLLRRARGRRGRDRRHHRRAR